VVLDCLLSRLQQRGNVVPAWIVVIAHWTTVTLSTTSRLSRRRCRRLCLLYCPGVPACFRQGLGGTYSEVCFCRWRHFSDIY